MATLPAEDIQRITRGLMSHWSSLWDDVGVSVQDLQGAVNATDQWIDDNQASYNAALPAAAQTGLTIAQKTLLFCAVALARVSITFFRRIFGGTD